MMYILWVNIIVIHTCQQIVQKKKKKEMNSFCVCLSEALQSKFDIDANIFVLKKKKKIIHLSLQKPLIQYPFYKRTITFIRKY